MKRILALSFVSFALYFTSSNFIGCWSPPSFDGLKCEDSDDCINAECIKGYCGGLRPPTKEPTKETPQEAPGDTSTDAGVEVTPETPVDVTCKDGDTRECYSGPTNTKGVGTCVPGKETCTGGQWDGQCKGEVLPAAKETCDGNDEDCNGKVDDGIAATDCTSNRPGECQKGKETCIGGKLTCTPIKQPTSEVCDGKDNNCDGMIDESFAEDGKACKAEGQQGECAKGLYQCKGGKVICPQTIQSKNEECNDKDDDCDGMIDETFTKKGNPCTFQPSPACKANGIMACNAKADDVVCVINPSVKEACNNLDDNCNGQVDEGCSCTDGAIKPCYSGNIGCVQDTNTGKLVCKGECAGGVQKCVAGKWGLCAEVNKPMQPLSTIAKQAKCNLQDNDCDGKLDETGTCLSREYGRPCGVFQGKTYPACPPTYKCSGHPGTFVNGKQVIPFICKPPCSFDPNDNAQTKVDFSRCPFTSTQQIGAAPLCLTDGSCVYTCNQGYTCAKGFECWGGGWCRKKVP